jgi:hypothetical protein
MTKTLIRKNQIRIDEFIKTIAELAANSGALWSSDTLAPSAAAVLAKIRSEIAGVAGAMQFRGAWSTQPAADVLLDGGIKKGYVYVYDSGTSPTGVTLEAGDTLIAKADLTSSTYLTASNWVIVNVNIVGAITEANLVTQLLSHIVSGNTNLLSIAAGTGANAGKLVITVNFPTISQGAAESGKYVSGISINATTGVITVTKANLPNYHKRVVLGEAMELVDDSDYTTWRTTHKLESLTRFSVYVNGVKQSIGNNGDGVATFDDNSSKGLFKFNDGSYIPQEGDTVLCDYVSVDEIS